MTTLLYSLSVLGVLVFVFSGVGQALAVAMLLLVMLGTALALERMVL